MASLADGGLGGCAITAPMLPNASPSSRWRSSRWRHTAHSTTRSNCPRCLVSKPVPDTPILLCKLSQLSYVATANQLDPLPSPLRDRFRVIPFPKPTGEDIDALLPVVLADLARDRGLDRNRLSHLNGMEQMAVSQRWPGGSVRLLRRTVEAVLRTSTRQADQESGRDRCEGIAGIGSRSRRRRPTVGLLVAIP
jgi:hypothetical protein